MYILLYIYIYRLSHFSIYISPFPFRKQLFNCAEYIKCLVKHSHVHVQTFKLLAP